MGFIPGLSCPNCRYKVDFDGHVDVGSTTDPEPGDVSICWACGTITIFVQTPEGIGLRRMTELEAEVIRSDPDVQAIWERWYNLRGQHL